MTKWAFIDYENISNLELVALDNYQRVIVFLGAKQPKLDFGTSRYDQPLNITIIQLKDTQANNLDFHLAYYLGKFDDTADRLITFDVVSNDNGFSPLISHIRNTGRSCQQIKTVATPAIAKAAPEPVDLKLRLLQSLKLREIKKRPQKVSTLRNHIASQLRIQGNDLLIQSYFNQLVSDKFIKVSGDSVAYKC